MTNRRLVALLCFIAFILLGISSAILGPTLPNLAAAVALPLASAGLLRAARQIGSFVAIIGAGPVLDRYDARLVVVPGMLLMAVGLVGSVLTGNLIFTLGAFLIAGVGTGFLDVGSNFAIGALYSANSSPVLAALHTFYGVGLTIGPLVAGWALAGQGDWRRSYILPGVVCVLVGALFAGVAIHRQDTMHPVTASTMTEKKSFAVQWAPLLPLIVLIFMYNGAGTGIGDWISTHAQLVAHSTEESAAGLASLYGFALTGGRLISIVALRQFGNRRVLIGAVGLATIGSSLILLAGPTIGLVSIGVLMVGVGFGPIFPTVVAIGGQQQPEVRGTVTSVLVGLAAVGGIIVPVVQGWIGGGHSGGMIVTLAASLIMVGALIAMRSTEVERATML